MTMRDLQRLEELSSAAALGLWADDVVLALDRAIGQTEIGDADKELLKDAASLLEDALERISKPFAPPKSARALSASETTLTAITTLAQEQAGDTLKLLDQMAKVVHEALRGQLAGGDAERLQPVIALFELISELQLVESNSVLTSRKDVGVWTATPTTSSFFSAAHV